jgi:hypothetical protein
MRFRQKKNEWLLYPEDQVKVSWDLFITLILLISCILTPYRIAFTRGEDQESLQWQVISYGIDTFFLIDILVIMNSAFYDDEFQIVEDRVVIIKSYLQTWFLVDLLAILPFDIILRQTENYQQIVRFARIGRMYKLIKMIRLIRVLKIVKQRSQLLKYLNDFLKIGLGFERLFFFAIIFLILCHILTCIWVITAQFAVDAYEDSWVSEFESYNHG